MRSRKQHSLLPWYAADGDPEIRAVFLNYYAPRTPFETEVVTGLALISETLHRFQPLCLALLRQSPQPLDELRLRFPEHKNFIDVLEDMRARGNSASTICRERLEDLQADKDLLTLLWMSLRPDEAPRTRRAAASKIRALLQ